MGDGFTVQETAERTGLSEHTLRYYERAGLLAAVRRDGSSGHRRYRPTTWPGSAPSPASGRPGCPSNRCAATSHSRPGRSAAHELRALLEEQEVALEERMRAMQRHLDYVRRKIDYWKALRPAKTAARRIADELPA